MVSVTNERIVQEFTTIYSIESQTTSTAQSSATISCDSIHSSTACLEQMSADGRFAYEEAPKPDEESQDSTTDSATEIVSEDEMKEFKKRLSTRD